jgi:hypothetical protein
MKSYTDIAVVSNDSRKQIKQKLIRDGLEACIVIHSNNEIIINTISTKDRRRLADGEIRVNAPAIQGVVLCFLKK